MFGGRRVIPVGITILSLFLIGFAFSATFTEAMIWRALMGFVAAAGYVPITAVLSKWFSVKERGFAMEMYSGPGGGLGEALTFLLIPLIALFMTDGGIFGLTGWRGSTFFMGIVVLAIAISSAFMLRSDPSDMGLPSIQKADVKRKSHGRRWRDGYSVRFGPGFWHTFSGKTVGSSIEAQQHAAQRRYLCGTCVDRRDVLYVYNADSHNICYGSAGIFQRHRNQYFPLNQCILCGNLVHSGHWFQYGNY